MMEKIIEQVRHAEGPSRELDVAIAQAIWPQLDRYAPHCQWDEPIFWCDPFYKQPCPEFTESFDAAMKLLPEGHDWIIGNINGQVGGTPYACVGSTTEHYAETPVLSFVLACLYAHAALPVAQAQEAA